MNERIKQLLKQSTKEVDPDDREWVFFKVDQEKFAELIVRECCDMFVELRTRPADLAVLAPVYFMLVLTVGIVDAFRAAWRETAEGIGQTKRMYWD